MSNKVVERCSCCGAKMYKYWHTLNRPMCQSLLKLYQEPGRRAYISKIGLTHNQICNFQKMRYWGVVEKIGNGKWALTGTGVLFCQNEWDIPRRVKSYRGEYCGRGEELVKIPDILGDEWLKHKDYVEQREPMEVEA